MACGGVEYTLLNACFSFSSSPFSFLSSFFLYPFLPPPVSSLYPSPLSPFPLSFPPSSFPYSSSSSIPNFFPSYFFLPSPPPLLPFLLPLTLLSLPSPSLLLSFLSSPFPLPSPLSPPASLPPPPPSLLHQYYKSHSGNLGTTLKCPVIRRRALEFYVDPDKLESKYAINFVPIGIVSMSLQNVNSNYSGIICIYECMS